MHPRGNALVVIAISYMLVVVAARPRETVIDETYISCTGENFAHFTGLHTRVITYVHCACAYFLLAHAHVVAFKLPGMWYVMRSILSSRPVLLNDGTQILARICNRWRAVF